MGTTRKSFSAKFKARIALEALKEVSTINEIGSREGVHPNQIGHWKKQARDGLPDIFSQGNNREKKEASEREASLYQEIGKLKMELEWLKKNLVLSVGEKRLTIESFADISIIRQCDLVGLPRSSYYFRPAGETQENLELMHLLDQEFTCFPYYGVAKMTKHICRKGYLVNPKRIRRLLRKMGLMAIYPKKGLSLPEASHKKFPYLLKDLSISRPNQVWATDITYIRLEGGFLYLVVVMDWFSRYVLSWNLSNTLELGFCLDCLDESLMRGQPEIFNSDQGSQFTSSAFTAKLEQRKIQISMYGRGRAFDNIFVERLWRSVKYEEVYLKNYSQVRDAWQGLKSYFKHYNETRVHQGLDYNTPAEVYFKKGLRSQ